MKKKTTRDVKINKSSAKKKKGRKDNRHIGKDLGGEERGYQGPERHLPKPEKFRKTPLTSKKKRTGR